MLRPDYKSWQKLGLFLCAPVLALSVLIAAIPVKQADAATGGYPWSNATTLNASTYDWGYSTCPSDAPDCKDKTYVKNGITYGQYDKWNYYFRNCTSFVAWKASTAHGKNVSGWGNAANWAAAAEDAGYSVNHSPAVGAIAVWTNVAGGYGHVGYVYGIASSGLPKIEEYNYNSANPGTYRNDRVQAADWYIHLGAPASTTFSNGDFVRASDTGKVYVIAGGAPMYVSNWANVGGVQTTKSATQAQINALQDYPANGTYIRDGVTNKVYVVAGGSALYVQDWANVGGQKPTTKVDGWVLTNQLRQYPANGTFLRNVVNGKAYVIAGGAALYIEDWVNVGGVQSTTAFDAWVLTNKLPTSPADGSYIRDGSNGKVYVVAGGSAMYIEDWDNVGGPKLATTIDGWAIANQLLPYPANGTYIRNGATGHVYVVAGGTALYVQDWANVGGQKPTVAVDGWAIANQLLPYPLEGTIVKGYVTQKEYQITDQQAVYISDPNQVSGPRTIIDDGALYSQLGVTP